METDDNNAYQDGVYILRRLRAMSTLQAKMYDMSIFSLCCTKTAQAAGSWWSIDWRKRQEIDGIVVKTQWEVRDLTETSGRARTSSNVAFGVITSTARPTKLCLSPSALSISREQDSEASFSLRNVVLSVAKYLNWSFNRKGCVLLIRYLRQGPARG